MGEIRNSTVCYIRNNDQYLMIHRISKKDDINKDKWIGIGGHFEEGESPEECMLREVKEETGLTLTKWRFHGVVTFAVVENQAAYSLTRPADRIAHPAPIQQAELMYLFTADEAAGGFEAPLPDCDEGHLEWVRIDSLPDLNLWEGDYIFLDLIEKKSPVFLLKLVYSPEGELLEALLDGHTVSSRGAKRL